jgi:hypothetical protein
MCCIQAHVAVRWNSNAVGFYSVHEVVNISADDDDNDGDVDDNDDSNDKSGNGLFWNEGNLFIYRVLTI